MSGFFWYSASNRIFEPSSRYSLNVTRVLKFGSGTSGLPEFSCCIFRYLSQSLAKAAQSSLLPVNLFGFTVRNAWVPMGCAFPVTIIGSPFPIAFTLAKEIPEASEYAPWGIPPGFCR